jgi:hypothetical protein
VLSQNGAIVGVAFATLRQGQNLNFAIPATHVRELITKVQPLRSLATLTKGNESKTAIVERAQGSVIRAPIAECCADPAPSDATAIKMLSLGVVSSRQAPKSSHLLPDFRCEVPVERAAAQVQRETVIQQLPSHLAP